MEPGTCVKVRRERTLAALAVALLVAMTGASGCATATRHEPPPGSRPTSLDPTASVPAMSVHLGSPQFVAGGPMPRASGSTGVSGGKNISPFLSWEGTPTAGTASWALAMVDTTAPGDGFTHWLVVDIPLSTKGLAPGASGTEAMPRGSVELRNDTGSNGYAGPQPPQGTHVYRFVLYAMPATSSSVTAGAGKELFFRLATTALGAVTLDAMFTR